MINKTFSEEQLNKIFKYFPAFDPKIMIKDTKIIVSPFYWNFSFITNFFPILCSLYVFTQDIELKIFVLFLFLMFASLCIILTQLKFYNKIVLNIESRSLEISPNCIYRILDNKNIISFEYIKTIGFYSDGFWAANRRYIIFIVLKDKDKKIILVSTENINKADMLVKALRTIIH